MRRVTWAEAESIHPGCAPAWDYTGLDARVLVELDALWFSGGRLGAIVCGARAQAMNFDPRVGLWVRSWWVTGPDMCPAELCSLQWFREQWCYLNERFNWQWDGTRKRLRATLREVAA